MKKIYVLFALLLIISIIASCFVACTVDKPGNAEQSIENQSLLLNDSIEAIDDVENTISDDMHHDVPHVLYFGSFEKIAELRSIIDRSNNDVGEYLEANGFSMNGLSSKEDIIDLFDQIGDLKMLHLEDASGYNMVDISYYVSYGYVMSTYKNESDIVRFVCYINNGNLSSDSVDSNRENSNDTVVESLTVSNNIISLYKISNANTPFGLSGVLDTANSRITILISNQNGKGIADKGIEQNLVESTLFELIDRNSERVTAD